MEKETLVPDDGIVTHRKKMVNIGLQFVCDTDAEALAVKEQVNTIVADTPAIQVVFSIVERPAER